ncbi:MAG: Hpt domain-containing protein [Bacteroidota bacterium]|nr:Hpt domain-containing protein [Bacteroidota bacterium]
MINPWRTIIDDSNLSTLTNDQLFRYFTLYFKNAKILIQEIESAVAIEDFEVIRQKSHKLKGSSMVVGAVGMRQAAQDIEDIARNYKPLGPNLIENLQNNLLDLQEILSEKFKLSILA